MGGGNGGDGGDGLGPSADAAVGPAVGSTGIGVGGAGFGGAPTSGAPGMGGPGGASPMGGPGEPVGGVATSTDIYGNPVHTGLTEPPPPAIAPGSEPPGGNLISRLLKGQKLSTQQLLSLFDTFLPVPIARLGYEASKVLDNIVTALGGEPLSDADMAALDAALGDIGGPDIPIEEPTTPPLVTEEPPPTELEEEEPTTPPGDVFPPDLEYPAPLSAEDRAAISRAQASIREGYEDELEDWYGERLSSLGSRDYSATYRPAPERSKPIRRTAAQRKTGIPPTYGIPYHRTAY